MAKIGFLMDFCGLEPVVPISRTTVNTAIVDWSSNKLAAQWKETSMCRQTKMLLPVADTKVSKACLKLNKKSLRLLTHLVTGHNLLNYHQSKIDWRIDPLCECKEDDETSYHVLTHCPTYGGCRVAIFGAPELGSNYRILSSVNLGVIELIRFHTQ